MFDGQSYNRKHRILFWVLGGFMATVLTGGVGGSIGMGAWKNVIDQQSAIGEANRYDALRGDLRAFNNDLRGYREQQIDPMLQGLNDRLTKGVFERLRDKRRQAMSDRKTQRQQLYLQNHQRFQQRTFRHQGGGDGQ